jgi:hypothetical protein
MRLVIQFVQIHQLNVHTSAFCIVSVCDLLEVTQFRYGSGPHPFWQEVESLKRYLGVPDFLRESGNTLGLVVSR